jgi:hypothetical protein
MTDGEYGDRIFPFVLSTSTDPNNPCNVDVQFYVEIDNPDNPPPPAIPANVSYSAYDANSTPLGIVNGPNPVSVGNQVGTSKRWRSDTQTVVINCQNATTQQCYLLISASDAANDTPGEMGPESPFPFDCPCAPVGGITEPAPASSSAEIEIIIRVREGRPTISMGRPCGGRSRRRD